MSYYASALWKMFKSWFTIVALLLDIVGVIVAYYSEFKVPSIVYLSVLGVGLLLASVTTLAQQLRALDTSAPLVVSNDNLSLGGPNLTIDSISLRNIGGRIAQVTNISSDVAGRIRVVDDHYMESFLLDPGSTPLNIMIREAKIIDGLAPTGGRLSSILNDWKDPFSLYVWYQPLNGKVRYCTKITFQSGDKFIRNLRWEKLHVG